MKRNFVHTVSVLIASAMAENELLQSALPSRPVLKTFTFEALAAAAETRQVTPDETLLFQGGELSWKLEERPDELWVHIQANGYAAMQECADHDAQLISGNGAIDYTTCFNAHGAAICVLNDKMDIREGLCDLKVNILSGE